LVGQFIGLAIRSGNLVPFAFPSIVWKALVSEEITTDDVRAMDLLSFRIVNEIETMLSKKSLTPEVFNSVMADMKFEVHGSDSLVYPLVPNGQNISLTVDNAKQFCAAFTNFRLTEFTTQCEAIRRGLATVVPYQMLSLFTWQELERMTTGSKFDVDLLEKMTRYEGYSKHDQVVRFFWQMMRDRFTDDDRAKFLSFVWGRSRLPTTQEGFAGQYFTLSKMYRTTTGDINVMLPIAHTCFFSVEIPGYTNLDAMTSRITFAMVHTGTIDADSAQRHNTISTDLGDDDSGPSLFS